MSLPPLKICPKCRDAAPLAASFCAGCAHKFRTRFSAPSEQAYLVQEPRVFSPPAQSFALPLSDIQYPAYDPPSPAERRKHTVFVLLTSAGSAVALFLTLLAAFTLHASSVKNTPGHLVSTQDAEALLPYCSPHQVRETLGAPLQDVRGTWSYPTDEGTIVEVTFSKSGGIKSVQRIEVTNGSGAVLWKKTR